MEDSGVEFIQDDRMIYYKTIEHGIVLTFFTLLVKMESLKQKCNGDVFGFFKETGCVWETNGTLCGATAMCQEDFEDCFDALHVRGMQCEHAPVDFYLLAGAYPPGCRWSSYFLTLDDGKLEFYYDENNKYCARFKGAPKREGKSS